MTTKQVLGKRGRPTTGRAVPVSSRVKLHRSKLKATGGRRLEVVLTAPAAAALDAVLAYAKTTKNELIERLLIDEWRKIGG